jgi:YHS domain-containing protein/ATP-dependent Zn protease
MTRPQFLRSWWFVGIVVVAAVIVVFSIFSSGSTEHVQVDLRDFVSEVRAGNIKEVEVDGRTLTYELDDDPGRRYETELVRGDSLTEILQNEGVSIEDQPRITTDDTGDVSTFLNLIITVLPIIIIVGIVLFFLRQAQKPQKMRWTMIGLVTNADPVCGASVDPGRASGTSTFQGITYHFCSAEHKQQFDSDPVKYLLQK